MTMSTNLPPTLEELVRGDQIRAAKLAQLRQDIQASVDSGPTSLLDMAEIKAEGRRVRSARLAANAGHRTQ